MVVQVARKLSAGGLCTLKRLKSQCVWYIHFITIKIKKYSLQCDTEKTWGLLDIPQTCPARPASGWCCARPLPGSLATVTPRARSLPVRSACAEPLPRRSLPWSPDPKERPHDPRSPGPDVFFFTAHITA